MINILKRSVILTEINPENFESSLTSIQQLRQA